MIKWLIKEAINVGKDYVWFVKESSKFMSMSLIRSALSIPEFLRFEKLQRAHRKLTPEQQEQWYLSGNDRVMEF